MWGMNVIESVLPKIYNGQQFIFAAVNYLTKWVEAALYASVTKSIVNKSFKIMSVWNVKNDHIWQCTKFEQEHDIRSW